jgi:hypothetical protein
MSSNYNIETDLKEAEAMAKGLSEYVRGNDLYGSTGNGMFARMPSLTVGSLLMRLRRLDALRDQLEDRQSKRLDAAIETFMAARSEWAQHYEDKMLKEVESRLGSMIQFFADCADNIVNCQSGYRTEILKRTIVQEVLKEMHELNIDNQSVMNKVNAADNRLHKYFKPNGFQWSDTLKPIYPEDEFWWLYQSPEADS